MAPKAQKSTLLALSALASTSIAFPQMNSGYGSAAYGGPSGIASSYTGSYSYTSSFGTGYSTSDSYPTDTTSYSDSHPTSYSNTESYSTGTDSYPTETYSTPYPTSTGETCGDLSSLDVRCNVLFPYVGQNDMPAVCSLLIQALDLCDTNGGSTYTSGYPDVTSTTYPGPTDTGISIISETATFCADCPTSLGGDGGSTFSYGATIYPTATGYVSTSPSGPSSFPSDTYSTSIPTGTGIIYASPTISSAVDTPYPLTSSSAYITDSYSATYDSASSTYGTDSYSYGASSSAYTVGSETSGSPSSTSCTDETSSATYGEYASPTSGGYGAASTTDGSYGSAATTSLGGY